MEQTIKREAILIELSLPLALIDIRSVKKVG